MGYFIKLSVAIALVLCIISEVNSCGGKRKPPPRCTWRTCTARYDGHYAPAPANGQCVTQRRRCHHQYHTHARNGGCPGSSGCNQRDIVRTMCKCAVNTYKANVFSDWVQVGTSGNCKVMERKCDHLQSQSYVETSNCGGINAQNVAKIVKERKNQCNCVHHIETSFGPWVEVPGQGADVCKKFQRKMGYQQSAVTVEEVCPAHDHGPENPKTEEVEKCLECDNLEYANKRWSDWNNVGQPDVNNCVEQKRHEKYDVKNVKVEKNKSTGQCDPPNVQIPQIETRLNPGCSMGKK